MRRPNRWRRRGARAHDYAERPADPLVDEASDPLVDHPDASASPHTSPGLLASDEPIRSARQDLLGRAPFAAALARTVEQAPRGAGFVIGVTGPWGDGKTSVLNMAIEQLEQGDSAQVVRFNPWLFSGADDLLARFFAEVAAQLDDDGASRIVASGLRRYAGAVAPFRSLPWLGGVLQTTGELAQGAAGLLSPDTTSAHERAAQLRHALAALPQPIAIFIDDIDRLRPDEISDVMRLVRLVGDFPNLVYVLAFERARVEEALGGGPERRALGADYLEKIIQAVFEMPSVRVEARERVLERAMSEALGDLSRLTFSRDALGNVYAKGLRSLFDSLRDVRRFANALPAVVSLVGDEVEVADILALEALRLLEPETYAIIAADPEAFTATRDIGLGVRDATADGHHKATVQSALVAARRGDSVRALLEELFPAASRHMGGSSYGSSWQSSWRRERRVASREVLDVYLLRGLAPGAVPQSLVRRLLTSLDDRVELEALVRELDGDALELLLRRLEDYEGQLGTEEPQHLIGALLDCSPLLRTGRRGLYNAGADIALGRALLRILHGRDPDVVERIVRAVRSDVLWARYELILTVGHVEGAGSRLVTKEAASRLERCLVDDVLAAPAERLAAERDVAALLAMANRVDCSSLRGRLSTWLKDPEFVLALLRSAVLESLGGTAGRAGLRRGYQLSWRALTAMTGQDLLAEAVHAAIPALEARELSEIEHRALEQAFRYAEDPEAANRDLARWGTSSHG